MQQLWHYQTMFTSLYMIFETTLCSRKIAVWQHCTAYTYLSVLTRVPVGPEKTRKMFFFTFLGPDKS